MRANPPTAALLRPALDLEAVGKETADQARRARILDGAMGVFLAYGFQRTTMDDIARAAEISRPALYLQFRNKTDIYRALAQRFLDGVLVRARAALAREAGLAERLGGALREVCCGMLEIEASPHGAEMLDMRNRLAIDIVTNGRRVFHEMIAAAIAERPGRQPDGHGEPAFTTAEIADFLLDAMDGLKLRAPASDQRFRAIDAYVAAIAAAVDG